ncbi:type II toxin-antitoxin system toxin DNA ADP-ribosyl transferase DarT [Terrihabitans sp. B22-R8]|uniref:type II toxin-antitoxin system toxin DNA ADP-ribosyl transferase DarT n=1 Tax=Terrihabitans sp. B22-R8 TaxID=3425128 RepID=UPI00403C602E
MVGMPQDLTPKKALIFRILHRSNLEWYLENGVHCSSSKTRNPAYLDIGNPDLIVKRRERPILQPPGGKLSDYVPFYFTPHSPMLLNIKTGYNDITKRANSEIVILVASLHDMAERGVEFLFTDRHAYLSAAQFFSALADLDKLDWDILQRRDFKRDPDDPGKMERYQAEALIHQRMPIRCLKGIVCFNRSVAESVKSAVDTRNLGIRVAVKPDWYF